MTALNFQSRFAGAVEQGLKRQSVRRVWSNGKFPFRPGVRIQLYQGMRTKQCRKLGDAVCTSVVPIRIATDGTFEVGHQRLTASQVHIFSQLDGFPNAEDMLKWFANTHGLPFEGKLITWEPNQK